MSEWHEIHILLFNQQVIGGEDDYKAIMDPLRKLSAKETMEHYRRSGYACIVEVLNNYCVNASCYGLEYYCI